MDSERLAQMGKEDPDFHNEYQPRALGRRAQSQQRDRAEMRKMVSNQRT